MQLCEGNRETGVTLWLQAREWCTNKMEFYIHKNLTSPWSSFWNFVSFAGVGLE
jgi:hypothetical protein